MLACRRGDGVELPGFLLPSPLFPRVVSACDERARKMYKLFTGSLRLMSPKGPWSLVLAAASVAVVVSTSDRAWCQQTGHHINSASRSNRVAPLEPEKPTAVAATPTPPVTTASAVDPSSPLGKGLASCEKLLDATGPFALPGLKGEITLDRCYRGRDHQVCVFDALISEAKSLTDSFTKIVDAKYPELNNVDGICKLKHDALITDMSGAEEFAKRFAVLKSQYESSSKCAGNIKQAFQGVVLTDMAQPPEILKSMNDTIDTDITRVSKVETQIAELAEKMQVAWKAMRTIDKIHRTMCLNEITQTSAMKDGTETRAVKNDAATGELKIKTESR